MIKNPLQPERPDVLSATRKVLQRGENFIMIATFAIMVAALFLGILNRNFIHSSMPWLGEIATFSMIYMVLLGTEAGLRDGSQVAISGVVDKFSGRARLGLKVIAKLVVVLFSAVMLYASASMVVRQIQTGQTSPALGAPMWLPYVAFLLSFLIIVVVQIAYLIILVKAFVTNDAALAKTVEAERDEVQELLAEETAKTVATPIVDGDAPTQKESR
ncbi:hypothetical protein ART_1353 [Arthrobacter sp. PAMC 25486]|uniref:TRAP transporter small permease n=1 Tax=Arthrobacter sp. PAMC 25486 TaxID=1494608 RepID=UPI000536353A|nr:TRAP transporter small permease [Arthrobacter sp. PAMC 25486]AIY00952.1 hypothetical protein ART_1353 [Arthrobacter sp. PAMC 25486]